ncbi:MAG: hypothetical protein SFV22_20260 [Saprospiraceae bacterium]|nr:hypothetical protein [Saprospiraceae bacterium]
MFHFEKNVKNPGDALKYWGKRQRIRNEVAALRATGKVEAKFPVKASAPHGAFLTHNTGINTGLRSRCFYSIFIKDGNLLASKMKRDILLSRKQSGYHVNKISQK